MRKKLLKASSYWTVKETNVIRKMGHGTSPQVGTHSWPISAEMQQQIACIDERTANTGHSFSAGESVGLDDCTAPRRNAENARSKDGRLIL